jgi:hypothetical protein
MEFYHSKYCKYIRKKKVLGKRGYVVLPYVLKGTVRHRRLS